MSCARTFKILLLAVILAGATQHASAETATRGILDLTDWDFAADGNVALNGEWEFYPGAHIKSNTFAREQAPEPAYVEVPGYWNDASIGGSSVPAIGIATYRLNVLVPLNEPMAIKLLSVGTAYALVIDGETKARAGVSGQSRETSQPFYKPQVVQFTPNSNRIEIIFHVSNFHHRNAGLWEVIKLGKTENIITERENELAGDLVLLGAIIMMAIYNLCLWLARRDFSSALFLGLFCILIGMRVLLVDERYIIQILPGVPWSLLTRIEYSSWFLTVPVFLSFLRSLFPAQVPQLPVRALWGIGVLAVIMAGVLPITMASMIVPAYQGVTLVAIAYGGYCIALALHRREEGGVLVGIGCLVLFYAAINDILVNNSLYDANYKLQLGLFIFVVLQSVLVSLRYSRAFQTIDVQSSELTKTSVELHTQEKLRKAAEDRSRELGARAQQAERLRTLALIARGLMNGNPGTADRSTFRGLLQDIIATTHHLPFERSPVDVAELLRELEQATTITGLKGEFPDVHLSFDVTESSAIVSGSRSYLVALVTNLVRYAMGIQPAGVTISVSGARYHCQERASSGLEPGHYFAFHVADQGHAINQQDVVEAYDIINRGALIEDAGPTASLTTALAIFEEFDSIIDVNVAPTATTISVYFPLIDDDTAET